MIKVVNVVLNGREMACEFWQLTDREQANFFNGNGFYPDNYFNGRASTQIDNITKLLNPNGKEFITKLYESMKGWEELEAEIGGEQ